MDEAVQQALEGRADLQSAEAQLKAAEKTRASAPAEPLPSVSVSADIGEIGPRFSQGRDTYTVTGTLNIAIWQGGRVRGDVEQSEAALRERGAELADTRGRVESDVRNAYVDLEAAASQVELFIMFSVPQTFASTLSRDWIPALRQAHGKLFAGMTGVG